VINLINLKDFKIPPDGIYIGRWNPRFPASPLANPFKISNDCSREQAIAQYRVWLWQQMQADTTVLRELQRIQQLEVTTEVTLMCWCYPLPCHGDIIVNAIQWLNNNPQFNPSARRIK